MLRRLAALFASFPSSQDRHRAPAVPLLMSSSWRNVVQRDCRSLTARDSGSHRPTTQLQKVTEGPLPDTGSSAVAPRLQRLITAGVERWTRQSFGFRRVKRGP
jgi:hypothetical protein